MKTITNTGIQLNGVSPYATKTVYANISASHTITEGMALFYDRTNSTEDRQDYYVGQCTLNNIADFAGVVASGQTLTGPGEIKIYEYAGGQGMIDVATDESVSSGTLLGPVPGSYYLGRCAIVQPVARCVEAVDRSATAGVVRCVYGQGIPHDSRGKIAAFFDDFFFGGGTTPTTAAADLGKYVLTGGNSTISQADALAGESSLDSAAKRANGVLSIGTATTGFEGNLQLNGEPFSMRPQTSLFFRARVAPVTIPATAQIFLGLNLAAATDFTDATSTDYIGFLFEGTTLKFIYAKDGTSTAVETRTGATSVTVSGITGTANQFEEVAFLVRNRETSVATTKKELQIWTKQSGVWTLQSHTTVGASICDNESLTVAASLDNSADDAAVAINLDYWEVLNALAA